MKLDFHKKHPLTDVELIEEDGDTLTEAETAQFRKIALRCVRLCIGCAVATVLALPLEFAEEIAQASAAWGVVRAVGYTALIVLWILILLMIRENRKLKKIGQKDGDRK